MEDETMKEYEAAIQYFESRIENGGETEFIDSVVAIRDQFERYKKSMELQTVDLIECKGVTKALSGKVFTCSFCNTEHVGIQNYCSHCGKKLVLEEKLKPCPFCGNNKVHIATSSEMNNCSERGGYNESTMEEIPTVTVVCNVNKGGCGATGGYSRIRKEAIKKWNARKGK